MCVNEPNWSTSGRKPRRQETTHLGTYNVYITRESYVIVAPGKLGKGKKGKRTEREYFN